jgi:autotransporter-associated beta strand protein
MLVLAFCLAFGPTVRAATEHWTGNGPDQNWTTATNWAGASPTNTYFNDVDFTDFGGATTLTNFSVNNIFVSSTGVSQCPIYQLRMYPTNRNFTTLISPGVALYTGAGTGDLWAGADTITASRGYPNIQETISFEGANALLAITGTLHVGQGLDYTQTAPPSTNYVTLNLSGLDTFVMMPSISSGTSFNGITMGASSGTAASRFLLCGQIQHYSQGAIYLAKTNIIVLGNDMEIGAMSVYSNSMPCPVYLGMQNSVLVGNNGSANGLVTVGSRGNNNASLTFNPVFLGGATAPVATFANPPSINGGRVTTFYVCRSDGGVTPAYGYANFTGGNVSIMASTLQVGYAGGNTNSALGVLTFDNGVVNVNNVTNGNQTVSAGGTGVGIINVNTNSTYGANATLVVNNTLTLGAVTGTLTAGTAGTINVNGGVLTANIITNGGGAATVNLTNGIWNTALNNINLTNMTVTSFNGGGATNVINLTFITPLLGGPLPVRFHLIAASSITGAATLGVTLPASYNPSYPYQGYVDYTTTPGLVDFVLTAAPPTARILTWSGTNGVGVPDGDWDVATTPDWQTNGVATIYNQYDLANFNDVSAPAQTNINLTTTMIPYSLTVSNVASLYTFGGGGNIGGATALTKQGANTLILDNGTPNTFTGGVTISGGVLQVGNNDTSGDLSSGTVADGGVLVFDRQDNITVANIISGAGAVVQAGGGAGGSLLLSGPNSFAGAMLVTNGSSLQLGSSTAAGVGTNSLNIASGSTLDAHGHACSKPIVVSGTGVSGNGAIVNTGGAVYDSAFGLATNITLAGDTTFSIANRLDLGAPAAGDALSTGGHPYNLTLNASVYFEWSYLALDASLANINLLGGTLGIVGTTTFGNPASNLVVSSSAAVSLYGPKVYLNKAVDLQTGTINNLRGTNVMNGAMTLEPGYCIFSTANGTWLTLSNVLSGSGLLYDSGGAGTLVLAGNSPAFTGGVGLYTGSVILNGLIGCGITNQFGSFISGTGTNGSSLDVSGSLTPGSPGVAGTLRVGGDLVLEGSATVTNNLTSATTVGGGVNSLVQVAGNVVANGNTIYVNPLAPLANGATYTLITYGGTFSGTLPTAVTVPPYVLTVTNPPNRIAVIVSGGSSSLLAWNNFSGNGEWDVDSSPNWTNLTTSVSADYFYDFDPVLFLDSITNSATPTTSIDIAAGQIVVPTVMTNNSTTNYAISGAGKISGLASIVKQGTSTLTIDTTNDFTGSVTIQAGTLKAGCLGSLGGASGTVYVTNGATLDLIYSLGAKPLVISGPGIGGLGALVNNDSSGTPIYDNPGGLVNVALAGNATLGGTNRVDFGQISPGSGVVSSSGSNYNLTVVGPAYREWDNVAFDTNFGNINIMTTGGGAVGIKGATTLGNPANTLSVFSNGIVEFYQDSGSGITVPINKQILLYGGSALENGGSTNLIISPVVLGTNASDVCGFNIGGTSLAVSNVISGLGSLVKFGASPLYLAAANTYTGNTVVSNGSLALIATGTIATSPTITLMSGGTLDVSARVDQTLTLAAGQTLQGGGTVNGTLAVGTGSTNAPGTSAATGTLTVTTNATLGGTALFKLNGTTNDVLAVGKALTYGGALVLNNISTPLVANNSFKLFNAGSYSGAFSSIVTEPPLAAGLGWNTNNLVVNGTISVTTSTKPTPHITGISLSGTTLTILATNGAANGPFVLLESTNLAVAVTNWTPVLTNAFNGAGNLDLITNIINPNNVEEFYILSQ